MNIHEFKTALFFGCCPFCVKSRGGVYNPFALQHGHQCASVSHYEQTREASALIYQIEKQKKGRARIRC